MCGLVGVVSKSRNGFLNKERDAFHEMLFIDTIRGDDSTGMMLVDRDGNLELAKEASDAQNFQRSEEYANLMAKAFRDGSALIGHNRKATRGVISDENAHPFVVDDRFVLVHNGTMYGDHKKIADVEVDSHAICHLLHQHADDPAAALRELNAAYALIWYDVEKRSLNFVRNAARPLYTVETDSCWLFASEAWIIAGMVSRHQLTHKVDKITSVPVGELVTFTRSGSTWERSQTKLDLEKKVDHTSHYTTRTQQGHSCEMRPFRSSHHGTHPYAQAAWNDWQNDNDDGVIFPKAQTAAIPSAHTPPILQPVRTKTTPAESELARKAGFVINHVKFSNVIASYKDGDFVAGKPFDYEYARGDNSLAGIFVYARMVDEPDLLIRCFVEYDGTDAKFDQRIFDLCDAQTLCMFRIFYKGWSKHHTGEITEGFGIVYSKEYGVTTVTERKNPIIVDGVEVHG